MANDNLHEEGWLKDTLLAVGGVALFLIAALLLGLQYAGADVKVLLYLFHGSEPAAHTSPYLLHVHYILAATLGWLQELVPGWDLLRVYMLALFCISLACLIFLALRLMRRLVCGRSRVLCVLAAVLPVACVFLSAFLLEYTVIAQIGCAVGLLLPLAE